MNPIGINTWLWTDRFGTGRVDLLHKAAALGFDWIEFPLQDPNQFDYAQIGALARDLGLGVSLTAVLREDRDLTVEDPVRNEAALAYLYHIVDAVKALGGSLVGGGIFGGVGRAWLPPPAEREAAIERVARQLRPVAAYAEARGVVFGIETLVRFRSGFVNTIAEALELSERVGSPAIQVMADTFHMNMEEKDVALAIERAGAHLVHVHANECDRGAPGSGHLDWRGVRAALHAVNYTGPLVIECFGGELKDSRRIPREMQRDAIAREGGRFLRAFFSGVKR